MNPAPSFWAVLPAAGVGSRMRADRPKQYLELAGRSVIEHTLAAFLEHPGTLGIVVALANDDPWWPQLPLAQDARIRCAEGGAERASSVLSALLLLSAQGVADDAWVLVHDAARPNLQRSDIDHLLACLVDDDIGGLLAVPVRDTLKRAGADGRVAATLDRSLVWQAYTPQMFRLGPLSRALADALAAGVAVTDEASAMEWAGLAPRLVEGRPDNLKITRPEDLEWLRRSWQLDALADTPAS